MPRTSEGHSVVTAYMCCKGAADAMSFYADVFGAVAIGRAYVDQSDGRIGHAEFQIGDTRLMISDEYPEVGALSPLTLGGTSVAFSIYVDDVDESFRRAIAAGAKSLRPPEDQAYGARAGTLVDPWGHRWSLQTVLDTATSRSRVSIWSTSLKSIISDGEGSVVDASSVTLYFQVPDIDVVCGRVVSLGGQVLLRTTYASGDNAACTDDRGLSFDLFKPILATNANNSSRWSVRANFRLTRGPR